jgi:glycosyltransferase involved in cell wall biosynthesis
MRSALDSLGHETYVLARPTRAKNIRPAFIDRTGVWDQPRITEASAYRLPPDELRAWGRENALDVALFDQNYGFEAIEALRSDGVRTAGRFVWEQFSTEHVEPAKRAFDTIYSLTACERQRYAKLGIDSPRVPWGIHPELFAYAKSEPTPDISSAPPPGMSGWPKGRTPDSPVVFFYPAGFLSRRKPIRELLAAFRRLRADDARLIVKGQVEREVDRLERAAKRDPRIEVVLTDLPTDEHLRLFASADVCVAPSRWEGLGLHLYEAMGLGLPVITNDNPPMNEVVRDRDNGLLVKGRRRGRANSGIPAYAPSIRDLARAMRECLDPDVRAELRRGVVASRERLDWGRTVAGYDQLLRSLA